MNTPINTPLAKPNRDGEQTPRPARSDLEIVCEVCELTEKDSDWLKYYYRHDAAVAKLVAALARVSREGDRKSSFTAIVASLPDVEPVAAKVHESWMDIKRAGGVSSRISESGEELMVPYESLSEPAKELDRITVRSVYLAVAAALSPKPASGEQR